MSRPRRIALRGILTALALVLSYLESFIPVYAAVPGVKLGLANIVTVFALWSLSLRDAAVITLLRVGLSGVLFGNLFSLAYSLAGAAFSLLVMALLKKSGGFSVTGVSVAGAVTHNLGQCAVAAVLLQNARLMYYMAVLVISGTLAGILIGILAGQVLKRVTLSEEE